MKKSKPLTLKEKLKRTIDYWMNPADDTVLLIEEAYERIIELEKEVGVKK